MICSACSAVSGRITPAIHGVRPGLAIGPPARALQVRHQMRPGHVAVVGDGRHHQRHAQRRRLELALAERRRSPQHVVFQGILGARQLRRASRNLHRRRFPAAKAKAPGIVGKRRRAHLVAHARKGGVGRHGVRAHQVELPLAVVGIDNLEAVDRDRRSRFRSARGAARQSQRPSAASPGHCPARLPA
jgi:hypothetical protein